MKNGKKQRKPGMKQNISMCGKKCENEHKKIVHLSDTINDAHKNEYIQSRTFFYIIEVTDSTKWDKE